MRCFVIFAKKRTDGRLVLGSVPGATRRNPRTLKIFKNKPITPSCRNVTFLFNDVSDSCFNGEGEEISHLKYKAVFGGYLRAKKAHTNF